MITYYLSLGANLGDREASLTKAAALLQREPQLVVKNVSPLYETPPWGKTDQPRFLNGIVAVETEADGPALLGICQHIEQALGRVRHEKWGARTIDLDIVYSTGPSYHTERLQLPHPYVTQRAFVLIPLQDVAPNLMINGTSIAHWLDRLTDTNTIQKYAEPGDWFGKESNYGKNTHCR
ncbi:MAG: 2-amino-4-hydroxy-6-hydroxymethyldihydropteridine diphosphokinase [Megasphaera sp.]|jgi:2-amino-4-hydroxy-6-hydroxymethyldihydropteridine diphosphokinase|nr:2-amino-4-hydroxy-6-hydroxymethyldihydropteridine diphosphokinase [Megasphaera sp.]MCH4187449.1 2-amino-4-hydroxy-6-hydroxymethyldihydropteridine diphosphokinase [Megasphaera sp.]MCH4217368.1 2-amino-4-hydroxy-6-hydroxymethyldihydropteridine diphosphokinase [Megasphaera sp.]